MLEIKFDDLSGADVAQLLEEHMQDMYATTPPESIHALDLSALRKPDISFWSVWSQGELAGCGALKQLTASHGEIKSMRTARNFQRCGVASAMLQHILDQARARSYARLSLETGSQEYFAPARALYCKYGFVECEPFADYSLDPSSVYMNLNLSGP